MTRYSDEIIPMVPLSPIGQPFTSTTTRSYSIPMNQLHNYPPNIIKNQKYSLLTFLPLVLYQQFKFFFNLYFLFNALSQLLPALRVGYLFTFFGPLVFVLSITIGKEAYDDYKRYKRDLAVNSECFQKLTPDGLVSIPSYAIKVGDLLVIYKNSRIPADCLLLRSSDPDLSVFVRTDQLDGETDWKIKIPIPTSQKMPSEEMLVNTQFSLQVEQPHKDIYTFHGSLTWNYSGVIESLNVENTLWMNTVLASQGHVIAVVIYTGSDTRACMNTSFPSTKVGLLDLEINRISKILAFVTFMLAFSMVAMNGFRGSWGIQLLRFLILFSSIIPISLRVNLDMSKTFYSYLIQTDSDIPDTIVRTSTLPEELGRIDYLLSDKTGTLTKNDMEMKKVHLGNILYGQESKLEIQSFIHNYLLNTQDLPFKKHRIGIETKVAEFVLALALCHNVTPVSDNYGGFEYQASSPDEIAIVRWTESVGLSLVYRSMNTIHVQVQDTLLEYEILQIFPFTSERKRMGIILKRNQEYVFYEKGADTVMAQIVCKNDWLDEEIGNMARDGLRTLVIGKKKLQESEYMEFLGKFNTAKVSILERASAMQSVVDTYLEHDLDLLGLTGVEDKLQDEVKSTLESLRNAGIKIWMLTGDKVETATCVAISSKLISRNQSILTMSRISNTQSALECLDRLFQSSDSCLIIDGESLQTCIDYCRHEFMSTATKLPAVVCCRCSPTQKAEVTELIKSFTNNCRVAAIGDGGNDVSMIQAAHVGIGIVGKEGQQASLAGDFSINQFKYLTKLLLWHGRNSYKRSAKLSQFVIHRGLIISIMQAVFSSLFYFAPISLYQGILMVGYATVFTMAPVFSLVLDRDISEETALVYPELYKDLRKGRALTFKTFFIWLFISVYQGGCIMLLAIWLFESELARIVSISFTSLILNELILVALQVDTWHHLVMTGSQLFSILIYLLAMLTLRKEFEMSFVWSFSFLWKVCLITAFSCIPLYLIKVIHHIWKPANYTKLES